MESGSGTQPDDTESTSNEQQPSAPTTTQVAFNITAPAYSSDELLVQKSHAIDQRLPKFYVRARRSDAGK